MVREVIMLGNKKEGSELKESAIDISKHVLVPKHEVLSPTEAKKVLESYHARAEQLPYILNSDPMVRLLGAKPGDIVKIIRKSETAGKSVYYRLVIEG